MAAQIWAVTVLFGLAVRKKKFLGTESNRVVAAGNYCMDS